MIIKYSRPEKIKQYIKQTDFMDCEERFTAVEATTKAGKTTGCIVWLFEQAIGIVNYPKKITRAIMPGMNYWWVAPVSSQAKIAFRRMKRYIRPSDLISVNNTELTITIKPLGSVITFKSADNPDSLYGDDVYEVIIDEASRTKREAWTAIFSTLTATGGRCKMIGNVKGDDNWFYELARLAEAGTKANWKYYKLTAADAVAAGILKQEVIDEAEATLPTGVFLELFFAIPFKNAFNKFCYSFDEEKHVGKTKLSPDHDLFLSFDFNHNPICCNVIQWYDNHIYVLEIIKLENSNIYSLCKVIKIKYPDSHYIVVGDASGANKTAIVQDNLDYFAIIKIELSLSRGQMQQLASNPKLEDNQILVNAILEHYPVTMDRDLAQPLIYDCKYVEMLSNGTIDKGSRKDPKKQADALDGFRYFLNRFLRKFIKLPKTKKNEPEINEED
jgi:hypothetical protein